MNAETPPLSEKNWRLEIHGPPEINQNKFHEKIDENHDSFKIMICK